MTMSNEARAIRTAEKQIREILDKLSEYLSDSYNLDSVEVDVHDTSAIDKTSTVVGEVRVSVQPKRRLTPLRAETRSA